MQRQFSARVTQRLATLMISGLLIASGCASSVADPTRGEDLRMVLAVSGGIAGVDWQFTIEGRTGEVIGDRCRANLGCDWEPGQRLALVARDGVRELADDFRKRGFFEGETKFGTECCDQFSFRLAYAENDFDRTVTGSSQRLPQNLLDLIEAVQEFVAEARR
jgi:hypothetical protein